ncbi:hypothetical protein QL285_077987 [Trifolium repens]|nr:hypothetical protein QL285_077987 [Trifolium repens]
MGYRKILLWSDRLEEVKEVVETVGWWCSLFEKVVPWSPEIVTNDRVTWLRCYGVPQHAWGVDLFRALAFKYGRFIEVDDCTHHFKRCDFARVKILINERSVIDTTMAVKVLGIRFDIRVLEEGGQALNMNKPCVKKVEGWQEEMSSRASGDGQSFHAVVEGVSESGSDADVSESCQVLLDIEAHGRSRKVTSGSGKEIVKVRGEVSEIFPNNLGNPLVLTNSMVNYDGDKGISTDAGIEESGSGWDGVQVGEGSGARCDEVEPFLGDKEVGQMCHVDQAQQLISGPFVEYARVVGCEEPSGDIIGPKYIRTKKGVFCLAGPAIINTGGVQVIDNHVFASEAHPLGKRKKPLSGKHATRVTRPEANSNRGKLFHKGVLPELPPNNKLRKFHASKLHKNRSVRRKKVGQMIVAVESSSESIQNSEIPGVSSPPIAQIIHSPDAGEVTLEVVLPCISSPVVEISVPGANFEDSGMACLIHNEDTDIVTRRASVSVFEPPTKQIMEAKRVMQLQEDVGIVIIENKEDHLQRIVALEVRDQAEKEGWELNREIRGSQ